MNAFKNYQPGLSLVHRYVKTLMHTDNSCLPEDKEINILKRNLDDYVMYIWMQLGDTRYNRSGYRNAVDKLTQLLNKTTN